MGVGQSNLPSDSKSGDEDEINLQHYKKLYTELRSSPLPFKDGFVSLFGGSSKELGERLYHYLFKHAELESSDLEISYDMFTAALKKLQILLLKETQEFIFSLFLTSSDLKSDLQVLLHSAACCSLHIGVGHDILIPNDHPLLSAIGLAISNTQQIDVVECQRWFTVHSPRMFVGLVQWLCVLLSPSHEAQRCVYHLPVVDCKTEKPIDFTILMWILSGVLPNIFFGGVRRTATVKGTYEDLPSGGMWSCLYSSEVHGFSLNRFQHHCFDYKGPSIMMIDCHDQDGSVHTFVLAMDSEWRDGTYFYGGEDFCFVQLQPKYSFLKRGAKLVSFNEKQRGFPNGLRVMSSQQHQYCLFEMKSSFEKARVHGGEWMKVQLVEVWGCGGQEAKQTQQRIKEWEAKEVIRRREINNKQLLSVWEDNPDRYLLEMGGIETARPRENL